MHSLHSYFLRPGDTAVPIVYDVERLRDGRSFATRRIVARQHGRPIYFMTANFQVTEDGFEHQDAMPEVSGGPDAGIDFAELGQGPRPDVGQLRPGVGGPRDPVPRATPTAASPTTRRGPARAQLWIRVNGRLGDDPSEHLAAFTYASDMTLLGATLVPHGVTIGDPRLQPASLDHSIWFHRPFRADEWWLYDQGSPSASGPAGWPWPGCSPRTAAWSPRWPRRA